MSGKVYNDISDLVGRTPLVRVKELSTGTVNVLAKLESHNPLKSVKDRAALAMIEVSENAGLLEPGGTIIEPTSGNTGIALAFIGAARGYSVILVMPDSMSVERRVIMRALGAELVLTDAAAGMRGSIEKAQSLVEKTPGAFMPDQFSNPANPDAHYRTTAEEIWHDSGGRVDVLICGVGTGGTLTGTARRLRELNSALKVIAVEPAGSPVLSGGQPGKHKIQGIGAGFVPENLDTSLIDEIITIVDEEAIEMSRLVGRKEGLLVGVSSGAALAAAAKVAQRAETEGLQIVVVLPDTGERYLSGELFDS